MSARGFSGRSQDEITVEAALSRRLGSDDVRIHPETLQAQARIAAENGNPQLADNLRRAAELTVLSEDELLEIYEALRPQRSTRQELETLIARLHEAGAARCAEFVREALAHYERRDLLA